MSRSCHEEMVDQDAPALVAGYPDVRLPRELPKAGLVPAYDSFGKLSYSRDAAAWNTTRLGTWLSCSYGVWWWAWCGLLPATFVRQGNERTDEAGWLCGECALGGPWLLTLYLSLNLCDHSDINWYRTVPCAYHWTVVYSSTDSSTWGLPYH